ncbi:UPF0505 protein C16orf62 [Trypanosoma theileri]|uniref:UPF0505 protein C16orf62 n=1 Tax=Trypanosoma theileri TaxID=67003 RepID=A0A1X0NU86_9TRYP|nr:UPF0505 protein C16orf62 [Trypanosoma theileri]ORC88277.1 UPF0505 protein C16orf62 [Trypanosoma theileri]
MISTSPYTILHPLSDVAGFQAISAEIEQQRKRQHLHRQSQQEEQEEEEEVQKKEEKEYWTDDFDQTMISGVLNTKYSYKPKGPRRVLHGESVRKEVLSTYSITYPIHSFIVFGEEEEEKERDSVILSEETKTHAHAERLSAVGQPERHASQSQYRFRDEFNESLQSMNIANKSDAGGSVSQQKLVTLVEKLHHHLKNAWCRGEKVQSLRIAIQAARLLSNMTLPTCYPSVYVLVAQVLDTFGDLVTRRLQTTAEEHSDIVATLLKRGINASDDLIPSETVEMCYNWFLKINSIRELIPRICIELSLLKCFRYMTKKTRVVSETVVRRLAMQIRGIADPLVAVHLRWYLSAAAMKVFSKPGWATASSLDQAVLDSLEALEHIPDDFLETIKTRNDISRLDYLDLFIPSLQWQLDVVVRYGDAAVLDQRTFLKNVVHIIVEGLGNPSCLLICVWRAFPVEMLLSWYSVEDLLCMSLQSTPTRLVSQLKLLETLCLSLAHVKHLPISRSGRIKFLNKIWELVETERSKIQDNGTEEESVSIVKVNNLTGELMDLCGALIQFSAVQLGFKQVNVLLGLVREIITTSSHTFTNQSSEVISENLFHMLFSLIISLNPNTLLESEHFISLLQESKTVFRHQLTVILLKRIIKNESDPNASLCILSADKVLQLCKILHDDSLHVSLLSESQQEMKLVERVFLQILDKTSSSEEALRIMCEARHFLPRFNSIFSLSTTRALAFAYQYASNFSQEKHRGAIKAFLTFSLVTVPAVVDIVEKLHLNVLISGVAFRCGMIVIGEAALEFALETLESYHLNSSLSNDINNKSAESEKDLTNAVLSLLPIGIAAPVKNEHLYCVKRVLEWCIQYNWMPLSESCARVFLSVLLLTVRAFKGIWIPFPLCQTENYSKDPVYMNACTECCREAVQQLLNWFERCRHVKRISSDKAEKLTSMALEIYETVAVLALSSQLMNLSLDSLSDIAWQMANEWGVLSASLDVSHHILRSARFTHKMGELAANNGLVSHDE